MKADLKKGAFAAALLATARAACALGLGQAPASLTLGEVLDITIQARLDAGEDLAESCVTADVYYGDNKLPLGLVHTRVESRTATLKVIRVVTDRRIDEPVVTLYLAAGCNGTHVSRKFVAFADPPGSAVPTVTPAVEPAASSASSSQPPSRGQHQSARRSPDVAAPVAEAAQPAASQVAKRSRNTAGTDAAVDAAGASGRSSELRMAAGLSKGSRDKGRARAKAQAPESPRRGGPALKLDPLEVDGAQIAELRMAGSLGETPNDDALATPEQRQRRAAAAALWRAMNASPEDLAKDQQRLQELEARLVQLRNEAQAAQASVAALRARVEQAEAGQRQTSPLMLGLAGLSAALAGALGWLLWRQRQTARLEQQWWASSHAQDEDVRDEPRAASSGEAAPREWALPPAAAQATPQGERQVPTLETADEIALPRIDPVLAEPSAVVAESVPSKPSTVLRPSDTLPAREVSVEELIDLEQQAEFFLVLGQDQAAIDLLESHIRSTSGTSPLPFLKLLELFQRRGDRADYESVREEFNARFNAYAPEWEADLQHGHALQDYPGVVERLQSLWPNPERAMDVLQASLLKREPQDETFDLPAYRELLFLYSVARDLAERQDAEPAAPIDLLLPLAGEPQDEPVVPLTATRPVKAYPEAHKPLTVDVALPDDEPVTTPGDDRRG